MEKAIPDEIRSKLETTIRKPGKRSESTQLRMANIRWIEDLSREELSYEKKERQLLMNTTQLGERVFIQYPGKESRKYTKNGKERKETAIRRWDFRPELYHPETNKRHKNMSFADFWATVFERAEELIKTNKEEVLRVFATLLYRMAFMLDHIKLETFNTQERDVIYERDEEPRFSTEREKELPGLFKYKPNRQVLDCITKACPRWGEMSLEAFLFYNELLVWNEDCKYYYRNYHIRGDETWIASTGRVNTLLTHIRILGYILGDVPLAAIFNDFSNQRGVSAASNDEVIRICGGFIKAV